MTALARFLAVVLLLGSALLGAGAILHPMLAGDGAAQLRIIADTDHWREIHLAMLGGTALIIAGIWVRVLIPTETRVLPTLIGALAIISMGMAIEALNTAYMTGAGWLMAARFASGELHVAQIFEATHPVGLTAARFGNLLVALGAIPLGWAEWKDSSASRLAAALAWTAAVGGMVGVLFFDESSRATLAAVALLSGWQVLTAWRALAGSRTSSA